MRLVLVLLMLVPVSVSVLAKAPEAMFDRWGTPAQCNGAPIVTGGTRLAAPFEITDGWLRHGQLWCRLTWFPPLPRAGGMFASTWALCGEDSVRGYRLDLALDGDAMRLIWDEALVNGPLQRCAER